MADWNPQRYLSWEAERTRPAEDLLARIDLPAPRLVVDLGCGPGNSTELLAKRWPKARVLGVDRSPGMLVKARERRPGAQWIEADIATWRTPTPVDVIFANASLQWLEDHQAQLARYLRDLAPGGYLAVQMPRNQEAPAHRLLRETAAVGPWAKALADLERRPKVAPPEAYERGLRAQSARLEIWESIYLHVLRGDDPVLEWVRATALRPIEARLDPKRFTQFLETYRARLKDAYPPEPDGRVLFAFRRLFLLAKAP